MRKQVRKHLVKNIFICGLAAIALGIPLGGARAQGQPAPLAWPPELLANLEKLRDAALSSDYAWRQVAHLTENIGPRPSGSPQAEKAAQYVGDELRKLGLEVRLEEVR